MSCVFSPQCVWCACVVARRTEKQKHMHRAYQFATLLLKWKALQEEGLMDVPDHPHGLFE